MIREKNTLMLEAGVVVLAEGPGAPEELPPGQLPRFFDIDVEGDIVNTARPGDRAI